MPTAEKPTVRDYAARLTSSLRQLATEVETVEMQAVELGLHDLEVIRRVRELKMPEQLKRLAGVFKEFSNL
jgi:hypothetical protein